MSEDDNSYLSLLFNEQIFIEKSKPQIASNDLQDIVLYVTHSADSPFEENLSKCFQRLRIDPKRILRTDTLPILSKQKNTIIFTDQALSIEGFPELKYVKSGNCIWFDSFPTISGDTQLKVIFWEKIQSFFST